MTGDRLLTVEDLAARWSCDPALAWDRAKGGMRGVWLGRGEYKPTKRGPKTIRFRPEEVLRFEASQEVAVGGGKPDAPAAHKPPPAASIPGWDGVVRGRRKK